MTAAGFFWCDHHSGIVEMSAREEEQALSLPAGSLRGLKCPRCHHHTVEWRLPSEPKPKPEPKLLAEVVQPGSHEARELFKAMYVP